MSLEEQIKKWIMEEVAVDASEEPDPTTPILESGLIDSVNLVQMVRFLEETFGIEIPDEELIHENFETIERVATYVRSKVESPVSTTKRG